MLDELLAQLAKDPNATGALAAAASAVAAAVAVIVSGLAVWVSYVTLKHQQQHNILSVRPIPIVTVGDFENSIRVKVRNHGSGPMVLRHIWVNDGTGLKDSLVECMPDLPKGVLWANFVGPVTDRSLLPGSEIVLLQLDGIPNNEVFKQARAMVREALVPLAVVVDYTDIYESVFRHYTKKLDWFGRHKADKYPE